MTDAEHAAALLVVQPGTRASFRRRVVDAMRGVVPAAGGFVCTGAEDVLAYGDSLRVAGETPLPFEGTDGVKLTEAFGFQTASVVETTRRVYRAAELYPDDERMKLPYFATHSAHEGYAKALLVFLHEGGVLFGLAGLERRAGDPDFSTGEVASIERLAAFVVTATRAQIAHDELAREAAALRAFGKATGTLFVVDRDRKRVVWAADRERGVDWSADVVPIEEQLVDAAEQALSSRARSEALPTPPRLADGVVAGVAKLDDDPVFGGARCAILRVEPADRQARTFLERLTRREREIARLLVAGYSGANAAAIVGLSEHTVKEYVRRLYAKIGASTRADLVRKLMSPGAHAASPKSILPVPDSSLVDGDDTLD